MERRSSWDKFKQFYFFDRELQFGLDISRVDFPDNYLPAQMPAITRACSAMRELEGGAIANPDEKRMVGHYWLRNPELAPSPEIKRAIEATLQSVRQFSADVRSGKVLGSTGKRFSSLLVIGIGGSALGPQFVAKALKGGSSGLAPYFFDNTDPDGMATVLSEIQDLSTTLCITISKSGGTPETRNGMLVAKSAFEAQGLVFAKHAVAVTSEGSQLDKVATKEGWVARFPMWDWVGGRTSELSAVGLLPAALQGFDIDAMLAGARAMDSLTRSEDPHKNPAMLMAVMWHFLGDGRGRKAMVVLPYNDRLELFSRYLQQLVMESLGKERDLSGAVVHQGLTVYGNKGSTDQHAYIQQLRDGLSDFFAVFIKAAKDVSPSTPPAIASETASLQVEEGITCGDYLSGFFQGTRRALHENGRQSISLFVPVVDAFNVGALIALFERAVGFYATLININAYHQPGVEAGKKAASNVLELQKQVEAVLRGSAQPLTAEEVAEKLGKPDEAEGVFLTACHLAANGRFKRHPADTPTSDRFSAPE